MTGGAVVTARARIDDLIDGARRKTGHDDFGGDTWREGLDVLVTSAIEESSLNDIGEMLFYDGVLTSLCNRLQVEHWYAEHPEIGDEVVTVDLLGVGFPRTGSTALSHLLAEDDSVRVLRMWETSTPCPPPGLDPEADAERVAAAEAMLAMQDEALPQFKSMLPQSATGPMEDHQLMDLEFKSQMHLAFAWLPTYAQWFEDCDMEPVYRYERRVLQLLQWRCGPTTWQLKSPTHSLFLDAFAAEFPEARLVMTHRDVRKVLPSVADLYCTLMSTGCQTVDRVAVGELNTAQWGLALDRMLAFRETHEDRFFDVPFAALQTDPLPVVRDLYGWLGRELTPEVEARMQAWRTANPRDKHGAHTYDAADFGITDEALATRFGAYRTRFGELLD